MLRPRDNPLNAYDPEVTRKMAGVMEWLCHYHRLEVRGIERVPDGPALFVSNHSGGLSLVDGLFLVEYYRRAGYDRPVYILAHDIVFRFEWLRRLMGQVGIIRAGRAQAREVLAEGHKLLVFPGGDVEALRPFRERTRVNLAGRTGWARLAVTTSSPVVPIVSAGSHETLVVLGQGKRVARLLGLPKWARLDSFPALLCLPWGLLAGPTCALPYFPLPAKVTVEVGEAMTPDIRSTAHDDLPKHIDRMYRRMERSMQSMLDRLYQERSLPILG